MSATRIFWTPWVFLFVANAYWNQLTPYQLKQWKSSLSVSLLVFFDSSKSKIPYYRKSTMHVINASFKNSCYQHQSYVIHLSFKVNRHLISYLFLSFLPCYSHFNRYCLSLVYRCYTSSSVVGSCLVLWKAQAAIDYNEKITFRLVISVGKWVLAGGEKNNGI